MEIAVQVMTTYPDTLRMARWCEAHGVAALAVADHYLSGTRLDSPALDQLVVMGGIARETQQIELCTLVSPLTFRHPAVHLKAGVTLDELSGGRFTLGLGAGWAQEEHDAFGLELYPMAERFDRLHETLAYVRAALDGGGTGFSGRFYQLVDGFVPQPRPANLRIVTGGGGAAKTPDLAGRFADEFNVFPSDVPMAERIRRARAAWTDAGRVGELYVSTAFPGVAGADRSEVDGVLARIADRFDRNPEQVRESYEAMGIPMGEPRAIGEAIEALASIGIARIYLQAGGAIDAAKRQIELFMEAARSS